jgi:uncharacterized OsmC-like protein
MAEAPLRYEVSAALVAPGVSEAHAKGSTIRFDSSAGQSDVLPGPAELLSASFAACLLKNVERFSQLLPFRYTAASVRVVAERQEAPPRFTRITYELTVRTDEPASRLDLLHRNLARHGTVFNTLAAACHVEGTVALEPGRG